MSKHQHTKTVFLIGSPRSGTTILENILNCHTDIAEWYEPYYLWEKFFPAQESDYWGNPVIGPEKKKKIFAEYQTFSQKSKKPIVLDKLPTHVFNIRTIGKILPDAKWIHILRDGRDVTLSIKKEWEKRRQIVQQKNIVKLISTTMAMLKRQPFLRYKAMAVLYELSSNASVNPFAYFNKSRWGGQVGWGPRFKGWKSYLQNHTTLEFNAMQWVKSVEAARNNWSLLDNKNKLEIRYEELLAQPEKLLTKILNFLQCEIDASFFSRIPVLKTNNCNKWQTEFTQNEIKEIRPILSPLLDELNYSQLNPW